MMQRAQNPQTKGNNQENGTCSVHNLVYTFNIAAILWVYFQLKCSIKSFITYYSTKK